LLFAGFGLCLKSKGKEINKGREYVCDMEVRPSQFGSCIRTIFLIIILAVSPRAFGGGDSDAGRNLEPGAWGGRGAALTVLETGAVIEFDCARGRIRSPITEQASGRFSVNGQFLRETGGPGHLSDKQTEGSPAVYSGEVNGSQLILFVELPDEGRSIGPYTLNKLEKAQLEKCL
jgi:hypothetical protein